MVEERECMGNSFRLVRSSEAESRGCVDGKGLKMESTLGWSEEVIYLLSEIGRCVRSEGCL